MAFERNPRFYGELKQTNEDIIKLVENFHKKSPYFDYTATFQDYIKQIDELKKKFPVVGAQNDQNKSTSNNNHHVTGNLFGSSTTNNTPATSNGSSNNNTNTNANPFMNTNTNMTFNTSAERNTSTPFAAPFSQQSTPFFMPPTDSTKHEPDTTGRDDAEEDSAPPKPNIDKFEEPDAKYQARCKLYERLIGNPNVSSSHALLGCGSLFIKQLDTPAKLHLIIRQDPDLRKVLLNQVITASTPLKQLMKSIQLIVPGEGGKTNCYIAKVKDDKVASEVYQLLSSVRESN